MVRIYSNVLGLSKSLARVGLAGHEARSISAFTSSFTRSEDLFDYVDAGDKKEGADHKIRGLTNNPDKNSIMLMSARNVPTIC